MSNPNIKYPWQQVSTWLTAILLISFFLPWVTLGGIVSFAGYQIPDVTRSLAGIADSFGSHETSDDLKKWIVYAIYLIPLFCGAVLFYATIQKRNMVLYKLLAAMVTPLSILIYCKGEYRDIFNFLAFGGWTAIFTSVFLLAAVIIEYLMDPTGKKMAP